MLLVWDGSGVVLVSKVLQTGALHWPRIGDGVIVRSMSNSAWSRCTASSAIG
jgi:transposase